MGVPYRFLPRTESLPSVARFRKQLVKLGVTTFDQRSAKSRGFGPDLLNKLAVDERQNLAGGPS